MDIKTELPIKVTVEADSAYATICWVGVEHDQSGCFGDIEETFCESIFIDLNPSCETEKISSGTFPWSGKTIEYVITQLPRTDCEDCDEIVPPCELIDMYVSPYYIPYSADSTSTVYYSYWDYQLDSNTCTVTRNKVNSSVTCSFTAGQTSSGFSCSADSRVLIVRDVPIGCIGNRDIDFYVKMPDTCCDKPSGICYEIGDVIYVDSSGSSGTQITEVEHSGGTIYFYFDYKMIDTDDKCNSKITYGRSKRIPWTIPKCETSACCITSDIVSSYTWNDHASCINGSSTTTIPLSITRNRDYTKDDCRNICSASTTYCIGDITAYTMDGGELPTDYVFPSYGGKVKLRWNYNTYTQYDDCSSAFTSGNTWEDIVTIPPYNGDCGDGEIEGDSSINCSGSVQFTFIPSTQSQTISYPFKVAHEDDCNMVSYTYNQERTSCHEHCPSYIDVGMMHFAASGGTMSAKTIGCDLEYDETEVPDWVDSFSGCVNSAITVTVGKNDGEYREGTIIFKLGDDDECTYPLIISQDGKEYQNPCRIIYDGEPNPIRPCDDSGVIINFSILNPNDGKAKS